MNRKQKHYYYKYIVKRHLNDIREHTTSSKNSMEKKFYGDRYAVQLEEYAKALKLQNKYLEQEISKSFIKK